MKKITIKIIIIMLTLIGLKMPISIFSTNNFQDNNHSVRSSGVEIISSSKTYNEAENRPELSFLLFSTNNNAADIQVKYDFYFETFPNNSGQKDPKIKMEFTQYVVTDKTNDSTQFINFSILYYNDGQPNSSDEELKFSTKYWFKIQSKNTPSVFEVSNATTIEKGDPIKSDITLEYNYDTISFKGTLTQPTNDYYNKIFWTITPTSPTSPVAPVNGDINITAPKPGEINTFDNEIIGTFIDGILPSTEYEVILEAEEHNGQPQPRVEILKETITTDEPPYVGGLKEDYFLTSKIYSFDLDYYFEQPSDDNYYAEEFEIVVQDEAGRVIQRINKTPLNQGSEAINSDTIKLSGTPGNLIKDESSYTIIGTMKYETKPAFNPGYTYSKEVFQINQETLKMPKPLINELPKPSDITAVSIDREFEIIQPNYEHKDRYNAYKLQVTLIDKETNSEVGTPQIVDETKLNQKPFKIEFKSLKQDNSYMLKFEYLIKEESSSLRWILLDSFDFKTLALERGTWTITKAWAGYDTWMIDFIFCQPVDAKFQIDKLEWQLINKQDSNFIITGDFLTPKKTNSLKVLENNNPGNSLKIGNKYEFEIKPIYNDKDLNNLSPKWEFIYEYETYDVTMPTTNEVNEKIGNQELTLSFDIFNVPTNWSNDQSSKSINNDNLNEMPFDSVKFTLYTYIEGNWVADTKNHQNYYEFNQLITITETFYNLNPETVYEWEIEVWDNRGLHQHAFNNGKSSGSIITKYKFWWGYVLYPILISLILLTIFFIRQDLGKQQKLKDKIVSNIFSLVDELTTSLTPYVIPTGYEKYRELLKETTKDLEQKVDEENKERNKTDDKKTLARLITGFSIKEIEKYEKQVDFNYQKFDYTEPQEKQEYEKSIEDYSNKLLKEQSIIKKFFHEKIMKNNSKEIVETLEVEIGDLDNIDNADDKVVRDDE